MWEQRKPRPACASGQGRCSLDASIIQQGFLVSASRVESDKTTRMTGWSGPHCSHSVRISGWTFVISLIRIWILRKENSVKIVYLSSEKIYSKRDQNLSFKRRSLFKRIVCKNKKQADIHENCLSCKLWQKIY